MQDILDKKIEGHKKDINEIIQLVFEKPYNYFSQY